ncbi:hypothetical protein Calab_1445 [Caldithrix abyssi DSM 13497]|uniref:Uncharacterized protein n=1 Tax=Caldithrix abyssi DSM 13497 TaxID=880073 RepID=H1XPU0_CALAY|nr:hypothetical protein [Caldithrix abyssi]APF20407.1 hypothetical protein Cabys_3661 [Caldithrix abyssi DSM 13497]EHO41066.1 hypothetical protein Calab_1445 [Caldithrix abyssi DSM 13497]
MLKLYLDYGGNPTIDLSDKILSVSSLSRQVESQKPGEPGVISLDNVSLELPLNAFPNDEMSFANLDSNPDYIFTIKIDFGGTEYKIFEGILDKSSVEHTKAETAKFDVLDKINALKFLENTQPRTQEYFDAGSGFKYQNWETGNPNEIKIYKRYDNNTNYVDNNDVVPLGSILISDSNNLYFVINSYTAFDSGEGVNVNIVEFHNAQPGNWEFDNRYLQYYSEYFGNEIIHLINTGTSKVEAFSATAIIEAIIKKQWPGANIIRRISGDDRYPISLDYWDQLVTTYFDKQPLEALKYLISTIRLYLFVNIQGDFILQTFDLLGQYAQLTINPDELIDFNKKYDWQKTVQYVKITNVDNANDYGEYPTNLDVIPTNKLEKEVFKFSDNLNQIAQDYYNFYGAKKLMANIKIPLNSNSITIDLTDKIILWNKNWFIISIEADLINMVLNLDIAEL